MSSLPASQPAEDGEADGATAPPTVDPSSEEPPVTYGGVRKSVGPPTNGRALAQTLTDPASTESTCLLGG